MIVVNSQHQNNVAHHQPTEEIQSLLYFPHEDHQNHPQIPLPHYMQQNYQDHLQKSQKMHLQQPQMSYQHQQQLSYQQQPQQNFNHQKQPLKSHIQKPQQQMIQKPYVHEAEQLPQPVALTNEPKQHQQPEQYKTQYPEQNKQEQYQVAEKAPQSEMVKSIENTKTSIEYDYNYSVHDENTNDIKQHHEKALNGAIVGQYSLMDADGYRRIVDYTADDINGFQAVVRREFVEVPKSSPIVEKFPVPQKMNAQPQYFFSPTPSMTPIAEVSKPTPVPQQPYMQLNSVPIVQQQQNHFSAPASTKHIISAQNDLQFFSQSAEKVNTQNTMIQQQEHQQKANEETQQQQEHPQQAHPQQENQQEQHQQPQEEHLQQQEHQFFFHPASILEKYLAPVIQKQQYYSAPTAAPTKVSAPVTEYSSFDNNHEYTEEGFVRPVSNYHY